MPESYPFFKMKLCKERTCKIINNEIPKMIREENYKLEHETEDNKDE